MKAEYDFTNARRAKDVPHLTNLRASQADAGKKQRITIMIDADVLQAFRQRAEARGVGYQTLINEALRAAVDPHAAPVTLAQLRAVLDEKFALAA